MKILAIPLCFWVTTLLHAAIIFEKGDFESVLQKAKMEDKIIFVDVYTDWCIPCKKLDAEVFTQDSVADFFNQNYINYKVNAEDEEQGVLLASDWEVIMYPTLLFISPDGEIINRVIGYVDSENLLLTGRQTIELLKFINIDFSQLHLDSLIGLLKSFSQIRSPVKYEMVIALWNQLEDESRRNPDNVYILQTAIPDLTLPMLDSLVRYVRINKFDFTQMSYHFELERRLEMEAHRAVMDSDTVLLSYIYSLQKILSAKGLQLSGDIDKAYKTSLLDIYEKTNDEAYAVLAEEMINQYILNYTVDDIQKSDELANKYTGNEKSFYANKIAWRLISIGQSFLNKYDDQDKLSKALHWLEFGFKLVPNAYNCLIRGSIHHKMNNTAEAYRLLKISGDFEDYNDVKYSFNQILFEYGFE